MRWETIAEHKDDNENGRINSMQWSSDGSGLFIARRGGQRSVVLPDMPLSAQQLELCTREANGSAGACTSCGLHTGLYHYFTHKARIPRLPDPEAASVSELPTTAPSSALLQVLQTPSVGHSTATSSSYHLIACNSPPSVHISLAGGFHASRLLLPSGVQPTAVAAGSNISAPLAVSAMSDSARHILVYPSGSQRVSVIANLCSVFDRDCSWLLAHAEQATRFAGVAWARGIEPAHSSLDALADIMAKQGIHSDMLSDTHVGLLPAAAAPLLRHSAASLAALPAHCSVGASTPVPHTGTLRHMLHAVAMGLPQLPGRLGLVQWLEGAALGSMLGSAMEGTALVQFSLQQHVQPVLQWVDAAITQLRAALASHPCDPADLPAVAKCDKLLCSAQSASNTASCVLNRTIEGTEMAIEVLTCYVRVAEWAHACATARAADADASSAEAKGGQPGPGGAPLDAEHLEMLFHLAGVAPAEQPVSAIPPSVPDSNPFGIVFREDGGAAVAASTDGQDDSDSEEGLEGGVHAKRLDPLLPCSVAAQCSSGHAGSVLSALQELMTCVQRACCEIVSSLGNVQGSSALQLGVSQSTPLAMAVAPPVTEEDESDDEEQGEEGGDEEEGEEGGDEEEGEDGESPTSAGAAAGSADAPGQSGPEGEEVYVACPLRFTPDDAGRALTDVLVVWRLATGPAEGGGAGAAAGVELPAGSTVLACEALCKAGEGVRLFVLLQLQDSVETGDGSDEGGAGAAPQGGVYAAVLKCNDLSYWPLAAAAPLAAPLCAASVNDVLVRDDEAATGCGAELSLGKAGVHEWGDVAEHCSEALEGWPAEHATPAVAVSAARGLAVVRSTTAEGSAPLWVLDIACDSEDDDEDDGDDDE